MSAPDDVVAPLVRSFAHAAGVRVPAGAPVTTAWELLAGADPAPGLAFAAWVQPTAVGGPVLPLLANSADAGEALDRLGRFHPIFGTDRLEVRRHAHGATVGLVGADGGPAPADTVDACFALVTRTLARLTADVVRPSAVRLRRPAPADPAPWVAAFAAADGSGPGFGAPEGLWEVDAAALTAPVVGADPSLARLVEPYAERRVATVGRPWSAAVTRAVLDADDPAPPVAVVARGLAVSVRSLQQRLGEEGTTYSAIVDRVRRERVLALLADPSVLLTTVAARAGLSGSAALTRAVRRWTGTSPTGYRREVSGR